MSKSQIFSRVNILNDFIIVFIIFTSPFLFFLYTIFPQEVTEWETPFFHLKTLNTDYNIEDLLWYFSSKFLNTLIFSLWFVTCKHWWRYFILVSILIEVNKATGFYYELNYEVIEYSNYYSFIVSLPLIILLFIISKKLNYYSLSKSVNKQIDEEIYVLMKQVSNYKTEDYKEFKSKLTVLRKQKIKLDKKEYLIKLIKLREDFTLKPKGN